MSVCGCVCMWGQWACLKNQAKEGERQGKAAVEQSKKEWSNWSEVEAPASQQRRRRRLRRPPPPRRLQLGPVLPQHFRRSQCCQQPPTRPRKLAWAARTGSGRRRRQCLCGRGRGRGRSQSGPVPRQLGWPVRVRCSRRTEHGLPTGPVAALGRSKRGQRPLRQCGGETMLAGGWNNNPPESSSTRERRAKSEPGCGGGGGAGCVASPRAAAELAKSRRTDTGLREQLRHSQPPAAAAAITAASGGGVQGSVKARVAGGGGHGGAERCGLCPCVRPAAGFERRMWSEGLQQSGPDAGGGSGTGSGVVMKKETGRGRSGQADKRTKRTR